MPAGALKYGLERAGNIGIGVGTSVAGGKNAIDLTFTVDGSVYSGPFDGNLTVSLPYVLPDGVDGRKALVVYCVDENGKRIEDTTYSATFADGVLTFSVPHFSYWVVSNAEKGTDIESIVCIVVGAITAIIVIGAVIYLKKADRAGLGK